ncbi:hypothetical protein J132_04415 [Termitomyces sp. J132]|nr:hypothetical protein J132_04415 [Termitomyces sp. J132]
MDNVISTSHSLMLKLGVIKYAEWEKSMYRHLMSVGRAQIVKGLEICSKLKESDPHSLAAVNAYQLHSDKAAGKIYQWLDKGNKIHVDAIQDNLATMWTKLCEVHSKSAPNMCFNSLSNLFNIHPHDNKTLTQLCTCVEGTMQRIHVLCLPAFIGPNGVTSSGYTLEMLDNELSTMAMLHALL